MNSQRIAIALITLGVTFILLFVLALIDINTGMKILDIKENTPDLPHFYFTIANTFILGLFSLIFGIIIKRNF